MIVFVHRFRVELSLVQPGHPERKLVSITLRIKRIQVMLLCQHDSQNPDTGNSLLLGKDLITKAPTSHG